MRILIAVVILALALLPAGLGAAPASSSTDCAIHMSSGMGEHRSHSGDTRAEWGLCCLVHCIAGTVAAIPDAIATSTMLPPGRPADSYGNGRPIEPALPPPRV
jgi:hypothetical protein